MVLMGCLLPGAIDLFVRSIVRRKKMKFDLSIEDYTIILNALHYYKKVEKYPNFSHFDAQRINKLRDKMARQLVWEQPEV
jgi:non-homologous end joining protein Ku|tara:strand:+ start:268 stop:507 length:240 start_codon:yes stop_codon:yes gene_type:complete